MKGTLHKTKQGWVVEFKNHDGSICSIPLHPTDLGIPSHVMNILGEVQEVEFEIVELNNGAMSSAGGVESKQYYAKVIQDNPVTRDSTALVDKMTPKQKALELCNNFLRTCKVSLYPPFNKASDEAKQCALIAVDEIIKVHSQLERKLDTIDGLNLSVYSAVGYSLEYWEDVKTEIVKL